MKAKIRGIYATALTRLLLDNGFEIVQPSLTIKKRFGLTDNSAPPDLKIKDRFDLQGIRVLGTREAVDIFRSVLHSTLDEALTRKWAVSVDGIYAGKMIKSDDKTIYVVIGNGVVGRLPKYEANMIDDKSVLVQIERRRIGAREPVLTADVKIVGDYAILIKGNKIGVSLKIRDLNKRAELYALGKSLSTDGWGIIWRESSTDKPKETLEAEVRTLVEKAKILSERAKSAEAPQLLLEGLYFMDVEFPCLSKRRMDELRGTVAPTLDEHHFYKSCGGNVSAALEMAEALLDEGKERSEVEKLFKKQIACEFPEEGSVVDVEHVKLSGIVFRLGQAAIKSLDDDMLRYSRVMQSEGIYDGLGVKKEAGDKAVSETARDEWYITTRYFSSNGELKGTYVNLNTPVEVYPETLRYVDLEVDVCIMPDGSCKIVDMEKLEKALGRSLISKMLFEKVTEKVKEIAKKCNLRTI